MNETPILALIPLLDVGTGGAAATLRGADEQLTDIMASARHRFGPLALRAGDRLSRRWLLKTGNPYTGEIEAVAARIGVAGSYLLNLSYEWACTTGVGPDSSGVGGRLLRTLDWGLDGLGRNLVVAHQEGPAGAYFNVTWPGFAGVTTAMAPDRFSVALNQPPMRRRHGAFPLDWLRNRWGVWRHNGLPPVHALRHVCDHCADVAEARTYLESVPLCMPGFFSVGGLNGDDGFIVERTENSGATHAAPACIANHWRLLDQGGRSRGYMSEDRLVQMEANRDAAPDDFSWVTPPILNETTCVAVVANAATGKLLVTGWEAACPATEVFSL